MATGCETTVSNNLCCRRPVIRNDVNPTTFWCNWGLGSLVFRNSEETCRLNCMSVGCTVLLVLINDPRFRKSVNSITLHVFSNYARRLSARTATEVANKRHCRARNDAHWFSKHTVGMLENYWMSKTFTGNACGLLGYKSSTWGYSDSQNSKLLDTMYENRWISKWSTRNYFVQLNSFGKF